MTTTVRTARITGSGDSPARLRWTPPGPVHLGQTLRVLGRGADDPTVRILNEDCVWITTRSSGLPVSARFSRPPRVAGENPLDRDVVVDAWGPGAQQWLPSAPRWVGHDDSWEEFESSAGFAQLPHRLVRARHDHPGMRLPATGTVLDRAVVSILEQRVTAIEAVRAYRALLRWIGEEAPGPLRAGCGCRPRPSSGAGCRPGSGTGRAWTPPVPRRSCARCSGRRPWSALAGSRIRRGCGPQCNRSAGSVCGRPRRLPSAPTQTRTA
ncbi:hypothetical protein [Kocuria marina]|uniref:hypothetical protein n=1 Tax=Kocuria marina TaxID=223184 RepID=UPI0034A0BD3E